MPKQILSKSSVSGREAAVETTGMTDSESPSRRDPIRWLIGCGILLIVAIAITTAIMVFNFRERALRSSERELENTVLLLTRHFDQQIEDFMTIQNEFAEQITQSGIVSPEVFNGQFSTLEIHEALRVKISGSSDVAGVNVFNSKGALINSSETWPALDIN